MIDVDLAELYEVATKRLNERPHEIPVPESHLQLAEERLRRYRENPSSPQPAFEVIERLSQDRK